MKYKKHLFWAGSGVTMCGFLIAGFAPPPPSVVLTDAQMDYAQVTYDRQPPIVERITLQLLDAPLTNGDNLIMRVKYTNDFVLPPQQKIYISENTSYIFHDDGLNEQIDSIAGDNWFGASMNQNVTQLIGELGELQTNVASQGRVVKWQGKEGIIGTVPQPFPLEDFNNHKMVDVALATLNSFECGTSLLRENSLFITDLLVVEDPTRTFNVFKPNNGTPMGEWTFGKFIQGMSGTASPKLLLKEWVKSYLVPTTINGATTSKRPLAFNFLVVPWLTLTGQIGISEANWESKWDNATEASLLKFAPFKLTAIVNRLDLRANQAFKAGISGEGAGETRFIFSLVGSPDLPAHLNNDLTNRDFQDWKGMNIILEYKNPLENRCEIKYFAQQWVDLSGLVLGSSNYNSALELITKKVTDAGAMPYAPNGSALGRLRSNERCFANAADLSGGGRDRKNDFWSTVKWQFRQFELSANSGKLEPTLLTNTPDERYMYMTNQNQLITNGADNAPLDGTVNGFAQNDLILEWAWAPANRLSIALGRHLLPDNINGSPIKALEGPVAHNLAFNWALNYGSYYDPYNPLENTYPLNTRSLLRHQLSANTCQGCHSSETKTVFTQVRPLNYGEEANYYGGTPSQVHEMLDERFHNNEATLPNTTQSIYPYYRIPNPLQQHGFPPQDIQVTPVVSGFLTGRTMRGLSATSSSRFDDDDPNDLYDESMDGLFKVFDPANHGTSVSFTIGNTWYQGTDKIYGFNELLRRKTDLCTLVWLGCNQRTEALQIALSLLTTPPACAECH